MDLRHLWRRLTTADQPLAWIREQDAPRAKRSLWRIGALLLFAMPFMATDPFVFAASDPQEPGLWAEGTILVIFLVGLCFLLAVNVQRPFVIRRPMFEYVCWMLFIWIFVSFADMRSEVSIGVPSYDSSKSFAELHQIEKAFRDSHILEAAYASWVAAACAVLALLISLRGTVVAPIFHAIFLTATLALLYYDYQFFGPSTSAILVASCLTVHAVNWDRYRNGLATYQQHIALQESQDNQRALLSTVIEPSVHDRLQRQERVADSFSNLTVLFADMVGFTSLSRRVSPGHLVDLLNEIFEVGDGLARKAGIEKVKTIGDCYMAVAGGMASADRGSADAIRFALEYLKEVDEASKRLDIPLALRVGIHTGPAVGGIIGTSRPAYDYWGDTVNLASRLESASAAGRILVSESTWLQTKRDFAFEAGRDVEVKGVGLVRSHFVEVAPSVGENVLPIRPASSN